jgi:hypothetical protein
VLDVHSFDREREALQQELYRINEAYVILHRARNAYNAVMGDEIVTDGVHQSPQVSR